MQLFEDVSGTLVLLFFSIIGWTISKWTHGRFAAFMRKREAELAKRGKVGADADASLLADSNNGGHEALHPPPLRSNQDTVATEKSPQLSVQNKQRARRRAKAAKADVCPVERELVLCSQGGASDVLTSHFEQEHVSAAVVGSTAELKAPIAESQADTVVSVPEATADRFPTKDQLSEEIHQNKAVLSSLQALRAQRMETQMSDETKLSQRSVGSYPAGEEQEKQDALFASGSSTHGDAQEAVSCEDDSSMLSKSSWDGASLGPSEPPLSVPMYSSCMTSADSCPHMHGDGWMMSFEKLRFAVNSGEVSSGSMTALLGQHQMDGEDIRHAVDKAARPCVRPTVVPVMDRQHAFAHADGPKSHMDPGLVQDVPRFQRKTRSAEQTPVAAIHREHAFVIGGRVFTPFTDVHGQHFYTDGEIVYDTTRVLANSVLTVQTVQPAEAIDRISDVSCPTVDAERVPKVDAEERDAWGACWDFVSIGRW